MTTVTGEVVCVRRAPDIDALRKELQVHCSGLVVSFLWCSAVTDHCCFMEATALARCFEHCRTNQSHTHL